MIYEENWVELERELDKEKLRIQHEIYDYPYFDASIYEDIEKRTSGLDYALRMINKINWRGHDNS